MSLGMAKAFASVTPVSNYQVSISPKPVGTIGKPGSLTSVLVSCNVQNGVEPITYLWEKVSGDSISISSTSSKSVKFSASGSQGQVFSAVYKCTATDSDGVPSVDSDTVNVSFIFESGA